MSKYVEQRHSIDVDRRILDVRPWSVKMQEKLSDRFTFGVFVAAPIISVSLEAPLLAPVLFPAFLGFHCFVINIKSALPFRYPGNMKGSKVAPKADGIMYFGAVREKSPFERFKQCWLSDSDLRKHILIIGSTGSGKSEALKGIFYNSLCWGSGFFCADGKADNKLPTDGYTMCRSFGRDDDILFLNFLLGSDTPQKVANSRRRRSNKMNPFSNSDADTVIQMGANLLPKAEGDGKSWQEKALVVWRGVITALCYKRDHYGFNLSVGAIVDYLALSKIEELYVEGYKEAEERGDWSYGYISIKNYLDSGLPGFSTDILHKKYKLGEAAEQTAPSPSMRGRAGGAGEQAPAASEQHGYRTGQLMPVLNLLDKTYGHIFQASFSEIDMIDVALRNRILFMLIPSLEKSSQEAENLGKLAIACLRVMMARNLGAELEGTYDELILSRATASNYPYVVALDELGYYFADGIAVMFAQARSLGMCMLAASQDLEKLTEGSRQAEAGAMIGNTVNKIFMKIDDPVKTYKLVEDTVGKIRVAQYSGYEAGVGMGGVKRDTRLNISEEVMISYQEMQKYTEGQAVMNALGVTQRISTFYMGHWLDKLGNENYHLNRFLQVNPPSPEDIEANSIDLPSVKNESKSLNAAKMMAYLRGESQPKGAMTSPGLNSLANIIGGINTTQNGLGPVERGIVMYELLKEVHLESDDEQMAEVQKRAVEQAEQINSSAGASALAEVLEDEVHRAGLDETLDEFGLVDPLSLIRKPISEVVAPVNERPQTTTATPAPLLVKDDPIEAVEDDITAISLRGNQEGEEMDPAQLFDSILSDEVFGEDGTTPPDERIARILNGGRNLNQKTQKLAPWIAQAKQEARAIVQRPRAVDNSVVGIRKSSLVEIESVERALGSELPRTAAKEVEQVVAANVTPKTSVPKLITEDEINNFFGDL